MYYVYILKSLNIDKFYKGLTNDIDRRLNEHFAGKCRSTKLMKPLVLVHAEVCDTLNAARKLEKYFKSGYGREIIKEIYLINAGVVKWYTRKT